MRTTLQSNPSVISGGGLASIIDSGASNPALHSPLRFASNRCPAAPGELYVRDSSVSNMSATYGAVLRVYQSSHAGQVGSIQTGIIGVLFDNCTFVNNVARRSGAVLSAYSPSRVFFRPFEYTGSGLLFTSDLGFLGRPLQRFGFNGNPNEDPWMATISPNGAFARTPLSALFKFARVLFALRFVRVWRCVMPCQGKLARGSTRTRTSTTARSCLPMAIRQISGLSSTG
jgi:hypothetical protein